MYSIIPLAGPDFYHERYGVRPLFPVEGEPLVKKAVEGRRWYRDGGLEPGRIIFVLRDTPHTTPVAAYLRDVFSGCKLVILPDLTRGALMTALAASGAIRDFDRPIAVDLVDILYESDWDPQAIFSGDENIGAILPYFRSHNEKYSYLAVKNGRVVRTAEKKVISDLASAGTYFFRNLDIFLAAARHSLQNVHTEAVGGNLFLCPSINGVIARGLTVAPVEVTDVREVSLLFHDKD